MHRLAQRRSGGDVYKRQVQAGVYPTRYEIKEPSLHEIFIEKVGAAQ